MTKSPRTLALLALFSALPLLHGCAAVVVGGATAGALSILDRRTTGVQADDETTEWKAEKTIPAEVKEQAHVNFTSYNRRVLISGEVPNEEAKNTIGEKTLAINGVRGTFNELVVGPSSTFVQRSKDSVITSRVKARLVDSRQISANHIKVVTEAGTCFLLGLVTENEAKVAVSITRTTADVRRVVNLMEVLPDAEIKRIDSAVPGNRTSAPAQPAPVETR